MILNYIKTNPTENMTIFILDPLPRAVHASVAKKIIHYGSLCAEQVGFLEAPTLEGSGIRLQMMGGEFCGNATRALAALAVHRDYPCVEPMEDGHQYRVRIEVSGVSAPLSCCVESEGPNRYSVSAEMPLFESIHPINFVFNNTNYIATEIRFPGISHVVIDTAETKVNSDFVKIVKRALSSPCEDALGIMLYNSQSKFLTPVVYTPDTDTTVWERGCGSGSAAVIAALAYKEHKSISLSLSQPGGSIDATAEWLNGAISRIEIKGPIIIVSDGTINI